MTRDNMTSPFRLVDEKYQRYISRTRLNFMNPERGEVGDFETSQVGLDEYTDDPPASTAEAQCIILELEG